jgi:UDP-N-acetylglucosamine acyltransferase
MRENPRGGAQIPGLEGELPALRPAGGVEVSIHPSAVVDPRAAIGEGVRIEPYAVIGPEVRIGARVHIGAHVVIDGRTELGDDVRVWPGAVLGAEPQDRHYQGEPTGVRIGPRTHVREHVTVHRATGADGLTVIGPDVLLMIHCHVAHNCNVGAGATIAGGALLAGHVEVGPRAIVSGNVVVHQFVRIGRLAMIGGGSRVARDVPPFALLVGDSRIRGLNGVGIRRNDFSREEQSELRVLYRLLYRSDLPLEEAIGRIDAQAVTEAGRELLTFLRAPSQRGLCR